MDGEIVRRAKEGETQALEELYADTRQMVYFTALGIVKNEQDAQDLVQDIYMKAFQNLSRLESESAFLTWLKTIATNTCKNYCKKKKPALFQDHDEEDFILGKVEEVSEDFLPQEYVEQAEKRRSVQEIIGGLPDAQRMAVMLYYFDELPLSEVSSIMETSDGTTKSRLNYARKQIKTKVEAQEKQGNKLYAGVPVLTRILRMASRDCDLPAEAAQRILAHSMQAASAAAGSAAANQAAVAEHAAAALEDTASAETAQGAEAAADTAVSGAKGIFAKIAGMTVRTKVIALVSAGLVLAGAVTGVAVSVKKHNDAVQAAMVLQQKWKAESEARKKAASEAAAKKKAAEAQKKAEEEKVALRQKLCGKQWNCQLNGKEYIERFYFYPDGKCECNLMKKESKEGSKHWVQKDYYGEFQVTAKDKTLIHLTLQSDGGKVGAADLTAAVKVGKGWYDSGTEAAIAEQEKTKVLTPLTFTLESGKFPYQETSKEGDMEYVYCLGDGSASRALENSSVSGSQPPDSGKSPQTERVQYPVNLLGASVAQMTSRFGKDYEILGSFSGGAQVGYRDNRIPYIFILSNSDPRSYDKIPYVLIAEGYQIDQKFRSGLTYQQLKKIAGSNLKAPEGPPDDNSDYDEYDAPYWTVSVNRPGYQILYQWRDKNGTWPVYTMVEIDHPERFSPDAAQTASSAPPTTSGGEFAQKLVGGWDWNLNAGDGGHLCGMKFNADGTCRFRYSEKIPVDNKPLSEAKAASEEYDGTYKISGGDNITFQAAYSSDDAKYYKNPPKTCNGKFRIRWTSVDDSGFDFVAADGKEKGMALTLTDGQSPFEMMNSAAGQKIGESLYFSG